MSARPSFFAELQRRHVVRAAVAYAVVGWAILQLASIVFPAFGAPDWVLKVVIVGLVLGFPLAMALAWAFELTPEGLRRTEPADSPDARAPEAQQSVGRKLNTLITGVLCLFIVLLLVDRFVLRKNAAEAPAVSDKSIAVLPLANTGGDPANEYFSDGMSEELINTLGKVRDLTVIGRNSSFQFKGKTEDTKAIAAKLGVAYLLEGSVRKAADRVRIAVDLVKATNGANVWSETYDRELKDIFAVQSEIAGAVAKQMQSKLLGSGNGDVTRLSSDAPPSGSVEAHNAYLLGRYLYARGSEADLRSSIEELTRATQADPNYALAWAWRSRVLSGLAIQNLQGEEMLKAYSQARAASDTAIALAPDLAFSHVWRGYVLLNADFDWRGAETEYRLALKLAPDDADAKFQLGNLLAAIGQPARAVEMTRQALATDPLNARWNNWLGVYLVGLGRLDEAAVATSKAIELQPQAASFHAVLSMICVLRGDAKGALAAAEGESSPVWRDYAFAIAAQIGTDRAAADAALEKAIETDAESGAYQIAQAYAQRGEGDKVFEWLDRAWDVRDGGIQYLYLDPLILRYKSDPRFAPFCRKVGLPTPDEVAAQAASQAKA